MNEPEFYGQPLVGWKAFKVAAGSFGLRAQNISVNMSDLANRDVPGEYVADCRRKPLMLREAQERHGRIAPVSWCECGIWALWDPESFGNGIHRQQLPPTGLVALVWGYGAWFANELSWRAERMRIAAFSLASPIGQETAKREAAAHNVPALTADELREFASYAGMNLAPKDDLGEEKEIWLPEDRS